MIWIGLLTGVVTFVIWWVFQRESKPLRTSEADAVTSLGADGGMSNVDAPAEPPADEEDETTARRRRWEQRLASVRAKHGSAPMFMYLVIPFDFIPLDIECSCACR